MKLQGERIELTLITEEDMDFLCQMECDKDLWHFEESVPSLEEAKENFQEKITESEDEEGASYDFVVRLASEQAAAPIGMAQIWSYVDGRKSWEIGFAILPEYGGRGYGREAAELLLALAFNKLGAHKVVGMCNALNYRSSALMEHIGMRREGVFKEELYWNERWTDQFFYSILDSEYAARGKARQSAQE
ncbi:ribosomal-protein-serine acetyltransferase [Paenibacillus dendritiformis]|uniref:GNAT family N-acetyltransferase n=1 Tax=Paenibacillus dendritiformis TaxID=130049 RepID=UPI001B1FABD9|nr:GNAT family protein [Paenibacillus dendritiformis]GIO71260.1 ribosomal-protein-serine acetyltransferase [Paenibacillus dendritiformis]